MAAKSTAEKPMRLKLLIDSRGGERVVFAEAGKDFGDFLFNLLSVPVGTMISLLGKQRMAGSFANLYESVENLNDSNIQPNQKKDTILKPKSCSSLPPFGLSNNAPPIAKKLYYCGKCIFSTVNVSDEVGVKCPHCCWKMEKPASYVNPHTAGASGKSGGLVKGEVTYMVTDDLVVTPLSTTSIINLVHVLNKFEVKEASDLEEKVVNFGKDEAIKLLKACLNSKEVLTDVFLNDTKRKSVRIGEKRERMDA